MNKKLKQSKVYCNHCGKTRHSYTDTCSCQKKIKWGTPPYKQTETSKAFKEVKKSIIRERDLRYVELANCFTNRPKNKYRAQGRRINRRSSPC